MQILLLIGRAVALSPRCSMAAALARLAAVMCLVLVAVAAAPQPGQSARLFKRGAAYFGGNCSDFITPGLSAVSFVFDWGHLEASLARSNCSGLPPDVEYVPMQWGRYGLRNISAYNTTFLAKAKYFLGYNEPDHSGSSWMKPEEGAALWPNMVALARAFNFESGQWWLAEFNKFCQNLTGASCEFEHTCLHSYVEPAQVDQLFNSLERMHNTYHKPIWLNEFACPPYKNCTAEHQLQVMQAVLPRLDALDYVFRYAWFEVRADGKPESLLENSTSTVRLTPLGQLYNSINGSAAAAAAASPSSAVGDVHKEDSSPPAVLFIPALPSDYSEWLGVLAVQGLCNRAGPRLFLNSSYQAPGKPGIPVMWPFPEADGHWIEYLQQQRNLTFQTSSGCDGSLCSVLTAARQAGIADNIKGVVVYNDSCEAAKFLATTAAGLFGGVPVSREWMRAHPCISQLLPTTVYTVPDFASDQAAYEWAILHLLPNTSKTLQVAACHSQANYSCGWADPLGTASVDAGVAQRAFIFNLSPDPSLPEQSSLFSKIAAHLEPLSPMLGWAEPEPMYVSALMAHGLLVLCGAPNLSLLGAMQPRTTHTRLPYHRSVTKLDRERFYLVFQTNEGDTAKNAYSLRGGQWLSPARGSVPMAWGVDPLLARYFPALWEYYVDTASAQDQFFGATGGNGYAYPWSFDAPMRQLYFERTAQLQATYMPQPYATVDLWEGGLNATLYDAFLAAANGSIAGFSQQPSNGDVGVNAFVHGRVPVFKSPTKLWYPTQKGYCKGTGPPLYDCIEALVREEMGNHHPPFFILIYGVDDYVNTAVEMDKRFAGQAQVIGAQDMVDLGQQAAPSAVAAH